MRNFNINLIITLISKLISKNVGHIGALTSPLHHLQFLPLSEISFSTISVFSITIQFNWVFIFFHFWKHCTICFPSHPNKWGIEIYLSLNRWPSPFFWRNCTKILPSYFIIGSTSWFYSMWSHKLLLQWVMRLYIFYP